jgi:hypothetical protein
MKKIFLLPVIFSGQILAGNFNYGVLDNHAYLPREGFRIDSSYIRVNDAVDIFNVRDAEIGSLSQYGESLGNLSGFHIGGQLGISRNNALFIKYDNWKLDYGGEDLTNHRFEGFYRRSIFMDKYKKISSSSLDLGFIYNQGSDIEIKNRTFLNSMMNKIAGNSGYSISSDGSTITNNEKKASITLYDNTGNKTSLYNQINSVNISDLSSKSLYMRILLGSSLNNHSVANIYGFSGYTDITTNISISPESLLTYVNTYGLNINIADLNRDEFFVGGGASYITEWSKIIMELQYDYTHIFRDSDLHYQKSSHELKMSLSTPIKNKVLVFIEGDIMFQQFNSSLPYLYNKYTQTQFDKKYGFAKFGLAYIF